MTKWESQNTITSAISAATQATLITHKVDLANSERVIMAKRKLSNKRPREAKYEEFYDIDPILRTIDSWGDNSSLSDSKLRDKLIVLLRLDTFGRNSDICRIYRHPRVLEIKDDCMRVRFFNSKTKRGLTHWIWIWQYDDRPNICSVRTIREYLARTRKWELNNTMIRVNGEATKTDPLLLSDDDNHKAISHDRVGSITKEILYASTIPRTFTAHSTRGAAITKALTMGQPISKVATHARCTPGVLQQHYSRVEAGQNGPTLAPTDTITKAIRFTYLRSCQQTN